MDSFPILTKNPNVEGYKEDILLDPTMRSRPNISKKHTRTTFPARKKFSFTFSFISEADKNELQTFESDTVNYCSKQFSWTTYRTPVGKMYDVRFDSNIKFIQEEVEGYWNAYIELSELRPNSGKDIIIYSREDSSSLAADDTNLSSSFTDTEYTDVSASDGNGVTQNSSGGTYSVFIFKAKTYDTRTIDVSVVAQTDRSPGSSTVYLQIYNRTTSMWETLDSNNSAPVNTNFTLSGNKNNGLSNYYDNNYYISCRVYQRSI